MKTWHDITVGQWQHIQRVIMTEDTELLRWIEILPVLEPITKDELRSLKLSEYGKLKAKWNMVFSDLPKSVAPKKWTFGDKTFICNPDIKGMTAGQFIDGSEIRSNEDALDRYHQWLAIWWTEQGKGYDPTGFQERAEFIQKHMPMSVAYPVSENFFALWIALLPAIRDYLKREAALATGLQNNGTGTQA